MGLIKQDTLYVSNFPYHFESKDLEELFSECGKVLNIRVPQDRKSQQSKGFAFVTMESERAARKALNYSGHKIMKRPLKVTLADKKPEVERERLQRDQDSVRDRGQRDQRDRGGDRDRDRDDHQRDSRRKHHRHRSPSNDSYE